MLSMAECAHSSSNHHSSAVAAVSGENSNSPQSRRDSLPSPWGQVVRGEQEPMWVVRHSPPSSASSLSSLAMSVPDQIPLVNCSATQEAHSPLPLPPANFPSAENSDGNHVNAAAQTNNPAWNKPSNGVVDVGPVMGIVAWPALSECAEASPKSQDESSSRAAADGSASTSQVPAYLLHPHNHVVSNATPNSTSNHAMSIPQRFNRHGNHSRNGSGPPHGGFIRPSHAPAPYFSTFQVPPNSYGNLVPPVLDTSLLEHSFLNNNWNPRPIREYLPHPLPVNDHHGMSRSGNFNPHMHRNRVHQNNENRRDHNRGSYVNGRNVHMHQQIPHPRSFWGPSILPPYMPPTQVFPPQPVSAYGNPMFYQDFNYFQPIPFDAFPLEHYGGPEFMLQHPIVQSTSEQSTSEPSVSALLVNQINYYFCDDNLVDDSFLKSHMDDQGWVSINLVAGFPRVKKLTNDIQLIIDSLRASTVVEVQGDKIRRRNEWIKWIPNKNLTPTHSLSASESNKELLTNFQKLKMEEVVSEHASTNGCKDSIFEDGSDKMKELPNGEVAQNVDSRK